MLAEMDYYFQIANPRLFESYSCIVRRIAQILTIKLQKSPQIHLTYRPIVSVNVVRSKMRLLKEIGYEEKHKKISNKN